MFLISANSRPSRLPLFQLAQWLSLSLLSLVPYVLAIPAPQGPAFNPVVQLPSISAASDWALNVDAILLGIIFIISGLGFCFLGSKLFRVCLFLAGAYLCAVLAIAFVARFEPSAGFSNPRLVYLLTAGIVAVIGGFVFLFFYKLGLFAIGALGGYSFALFLLTLKSDGLISGSWAQFAFIAAFAIIGGIATLVVEPHAVRIATSIGGAYLTILGVDVFTKLGFAAAARQFIAQPSLSFEATGKLYGMVAAFVILAVIGICVQYKKTGRNYTGSRSIGKA